MNNNDRQKCHLSLGPFCTNGTAFSDMGDDFLKAYVTFVELSIPTIRQDGTNVTDIFNKHYVEARKKIPVPVPKPSEEGKIGLYLFLGVAVFAVLAMAILLLIIYIKRRKEEDTPLEEEGDT